MTASPKSATPTEAAYKAWLGNPIMIAAVSALPDKTLHSLLDSILYATFCEGAKYATDRCADAGHGER